MNDSTPWQNALSRKRILDRAQPPALKQPTLVEGGGTSPRTWPYVLPTPWLPFLVFTLRAMGSPQVSGDLSLVLVIKSVLGIFLSL